MKHSNASSSKQPKVNTMMQRSWKTYIQAPISQSLMTGRCCMVHYSTATRHSSRIVHSLSYSSYQCLQMGRLHFWHSPRFSWHFLTKKRMRKCYRVQHAVDLLKNKCNCVNAGSITCLRYVNLTSRNPTGHQLNMYFVKKCLTLPHCY